MKKLNNDTSFSNSGPTWYLLLFFGILLISCKKGDEKSNAPANKLIDLDELSQPTNYSVFSDIKTISPVFQKISPVINATGFISYDPQLINKISAKFSGRIEQLNVRFNFETITKGQEIMEIYSPEIVTAQQDLIFLLSQSPADEQMINSSKQKLLLLGVTDQQIQQIESTKKTINPLPVYSPYSGHIHDIGFITNGTAPGRQQPMNNMSGDNPGEQEPASYQEQLRPGNQSVSNTSELTLKEGMYIQSGQALFAVYNTSKVWAVLNIFPNDARFIKQGDSTMVTAETDPQHIISAQINYIEPATGSNASAVLARIYLKNSDKLNLKIGTLVSARVMASGISGYWLPKTALVQLGHRYVAFVKTGNHFIAREILTGYTTDLMIQVLSGLKEDETVAENAQFLVDSESFIQTKEDEKE